MYNILHVKKGKVLKTVPTLRLAMREIAKLTPVGLKRGTRSGTTGPESNWIFEFREV